MNESVSEPQKFNGALVIQPLRVDPTKSLVVAHKLDRSGPKFSSLAHLPTPVLKDIIPTLNSQVRVTEVASILHVSRATITEYCKASGYKWSIEHRAYITAEDYAKYKASKPIKQPRLRRSSLGSKKTKKITICVSSTTYNLLQMRTYAAKQSIDEIVAALVESSATPDQIFMAKNYSLNVKSKEISE